MTTSKKGRETRVYLAAEIKRICLDAGADDVGLVDLDRDALEKEREGILPVYSLTRSIISLVMNKFLERESAAPPVFNSYGLRASLSSSLEQSLPHTGRENAIRQGLAIVSYIHERSCFSS